MKMMLKPIPEIYTLDEIIDCYLENLFIQIAFMQNKSGMYVHTATEEVLQHLDGCVRDIERRL